MADLGVPRMVWGRIWAVSRVAGAHLGVFGGSSGVLEGNPSVFVRISTQRRGFGSARSIWSVCSVWVVWSV